MNDEQLRLRQLAIRGRRQFLELLFSRNGTQPERVGLVALSRVIFLLATRFVRRPEWPGHEVGEECELLWEVEWYSNYLQSLGELIPNLQAAVRDGRITPRGSMTRAPLTRLLRPWLDLNTKQVVDAEGKDFWTNAAPSPAGAGWADAVIMPAGVCVSLSDVATWADSEGIASPDEVAALLGAAAIPQAEIPLSVAADDSEIERSDTAPAKWSRGLKLIAWSVARGLVNDGNSITGPALWEGMAAAELVAVTGNTLRFKKADAKLSAGESEVKESTVKKDWCGQLKKVFASTA